MLEAQWIAGSEDSHEAKWQHKLLRNIHGKDTSPLPNNCTKQVTLSHITTGIIQAHTQHIDVYYHNSRDIHAPTIVDCFYVHANKNVAHILTKALMQMVNNKFTKVM